MTNFFTEVRQTLVPHNEVKHGLLPPLLVSIVYPLVCAFIVMAIVAVAVRVLSRTDPAWIRAS